MGTDTDVCDLFACVYIQGTLVYSLIQRTFVALACTELDSQEITRQAQSLAHNSHPLLSQVQLQPTNVVLEQGCLSSEVLLYKYWQLPAYLHCVRVSLWGSCRRGRLRQSSSGWWPGWPHPSRCQTLPQRLAAAASSRTPWNPHHSCNKSKEIKYQNLKNQWYTETGDTLNKLYLKRSIKQVVPNIIITIIIIIVVVVAATHQVLHRQTSTSPYLWARRILL